MKMLTKKNREKSVMADVRALSPLALEWLILPRSGHGDIKKVPRTLTVKANDLLNA